MLEHEDHIRPHQAAEYSADAHSLADRQPSRSRQYQTGEPPGNVLPPEGSLHGPMSILDSTCETCGAPVRILLQDPSLDILAVEKTCLCPAKERSIVLMD